MCSKTQLHCWLPPMHVGAGANAALESWRLWQSLHLHAATSMQTVCLAPRRRNSSSHRRTHRPRSRVLFFSLAWHAEVRAEAAHPCCSACSMAGLGCWLTPMHVCTGAHHSRLMLAVSMPSPSRRHLAAGSASRPCPPCAQRVHTVHTLLSCARHKCQCMLHACLKARMHLAN